MLNLNDGLYSFIAMKTEPAISPETLVLLYQTKRLHFIALRLHYVL